MGTIVAFREELKAVLRPFAEFLRWSDGADGDEITNWHSNQGVGRRRITVGDLRAAKDLLSRLEAEGSRQPAAHVAPPAPADTSGRAIVERWLARNVPPPRITFLESESLQSLIDEALASEYSRGERSGIEKSELEVLRVRDRHDKSNSYWALNEAAAAIRALNTTTPGGTT